MPHARLRWLTAPVWIVGMALLLATLLPLADTNAGWIRLFDFPRLQVAVLTALLLVVALLLLDRSRRSVRWFVAALLLGVLYQTSRIVPFTPLAPLEAVSARSCPAPSQLRLLVANVLESNRSSDPLLALIRSARPDIVLLLETDDWWDRRLSALRPDYPYSVRRPQENTYGMHLFSRLALIAPRVRFLLDAHVPSITTGVRLPSGAIVRVHGVHPKPPHLFRGTARRDAELLLVAREITAERTPAIVAGDLNDVAWSRTNQLFQETSGLLDPRVGRGLFPTYNAKWPLLRWPLDHVFFEESFAVVALRRTGSIGSDHFPILITLCHDEAAAARQEPPEADPVSRREARDAIDEGTP